MKRRNFLKALGLGMTGTAIYPGLALTSNQISNKPNIILIMADEGGIATPFIAYCPGMIKEGGKIIHQVCHVMDIMATCVEISGTEYPDFYNNQSILPLEGKSLMPIFQGTQSQGYEALYWQFGSSCAIRKGKWKLVCSHINSRTGIDYFNDSDVKSMRQWELYDMQIDRTETNNLAHKYPEIVKQMTQAWVEWNKRMQKK
ncbi:hypothetical protein GF337_13325 [candidate division KSB1 bacterium]|nr:hypothetical protein [candidate division KSB1 bacterium]